MGRVHEDKQCTLLHNTAQTTRKQAEKPLDETGIGPGTLLSPNVEIVGKGRTPCPKCAHAELMLIPQEHLRQQDPLQRALLTHGGQQDLRSPRVARSSAQRPFICVTSSQSPSQCPAGCRTIEVSSMLTNNCGFGDSFQASFMN